MLRKEYKIGERFEFEGFLIECVEDTIATEGCDDCFFGNEWCIYYQCQACLRIDGKGVHFEKVVENEKVG